MPRYRDEDWLCSKYWDEGMTLEEMGDVCGVRYQTILRWMKKKGVERRSTGHQQSDGEYKNEEWLRKQYRDKNRSISDIAGQFDVSDTSILYYMDKFGIETRDDSEAISLSWEGDDERREWAAQNVMENARPKAPQNKQGQHREETIEKMREVKIGEKNPMWQGGYEDVYRRRWYAAREATIERDEECLVCGSETNLHVHHIVPVREYDDEQKAHCLENLMVVCRSCHPEVEKKYRDEGEQAVREVYL